MIGDWVQHRDEFNEVTGPFKVDLMSNHEIGFEGENFARSLNNNIEPIPLTPEIFEKNGFERSKVFVEWKYQNNIVYMIYKPFPYLKIQMEECLVVFPCEYVHQLQHALRLCGIDKEIKL